MQQSSSSDNTTINTPKVLVWTTGTDDGKELLESKLSNPSFDNNHEYGGGRANYTAAGGGGCSLCR